MKKFVMAFAGRDEFRIDVELVAFDSDFSVDQRATAGMIGKSKRDSRFVPHVFSFSQLPGIRENFAVLIADCLIASADIEDIRDPYILPFEKLALGRSHLHVGRHTVSGDDDFLSLVREE